MVKDSGAILAAELRKYSTCVLSKSGQNMDGAGLGISDVALELDDKDTLVLHLGHQ